jgi:hypothetical protein
MEPTVQTDRTTLNNKLIIVIKIKNKKCNIHCTFRKQKYYQREADKIPPPKKKTRP